jgi:hypothetical protein
MALTWILRWLLTVVSSRLMPIAITDEPNFSDIEVAEYDWSKSIYGNASKQGCS